MKIIHCADLHIGLELGPIDVETRMPGRVVDFLESFDIMIEYAKDNNIDALFIAGDVFHTASPNPMILNAFASRITEAAALFPIVILVGNHDTPGPLHKKSAVDIFEKFKLENVYVGNTFSNITIHTKSGPVQVTLFPYPTRHLLSSGKKLIKWENYYDEIVSVLNMLRTDIDMTIPSVFLGHFTISGSVYGSERSMVMSNEADIDLFDLLNWLPGDSSTIECPWDYIALGHIHHHQEVLDKPPIVYAGSLDRIDFGEEHDDKGFVVVNIDPKDEYANDVSYEFISVDPRPMCSIHIDTKGKKHPHRYAVNKIGDYDIVDAIVRVVIDTDSAIYIDTNVFTDELYNAGAYWVRGVQVIEPRVLSVRLDFDKPPAAYTQVELLEMFFDTDTIDDDEYNELLDLAEDIMAGDS